MAIGANLTKRDQTLIAMSVIAISLAGAYGYFMYMPKRAELVALEEHVATLDAKNEAARKELANGSVAKLQQQAAEYRASLTVLQELVPTSNEVPALLESVSTAARRVGLDLASVEPMPVIEGEMFDTYRYKLSVKGGYHAVAGFLANVGSLNRIVAPIAVDVKGFDKKKANPREGESSLDTDFQIQTYIARPTGSADAEATGEAGQ
jgi:type IV pilus assembly protein PilO